MASCQAGGSAILKLLTALKKFFDRLTKRSRYELNTVDDGSTSMSAGRYMPANGGVALLDHRPSGGDGPSVCVAVRGSLMRSRCLPDLTNVDPKDPIGSEPALKTAPENTALAEVGHTQDSHSRASESLESHTTVRSPQPDSGFEPQFAKDAWEIAEKSALGAVAEGTAFIDFGHAQGLPSHASSLLKSHTANRSFPVDTSPGQGTTEDDDVSQIKSTCGAVAEGVMFMDADRVHDASSSTRRSLKSRSSAGSPRSDTGHEPQSAEGVDEKWIKSAPEAFAEGDNLVSLGHAEGSPSRSCGSLASHTTARSPQPHSGPGPQSTEDDDEDWINSALGAVTCGLTFIDVGRSQDKSSRASRSLDSHTTARSPRSDSGLGPQLTEDDDGKWIKSGLGEVTDRPSFMDRGHVEDWLSSASRSLDYHTTARSPPSDSGPGAESTEDDDENWIKFARGAVAVGPFMNVGHAQDTPSRAGRSPKSSTSAGSPRSDSGLESQSAEAVNENWIRSTLEAVAGRAQFVGVGHAGDSPSQTCGSLERHTTDRDPQPDSGPRPQATEGDDEDWIKSAFGTEAKRTASVGVDAQGSPSIISRSFEEGSPLSTSRLSEGHTTDCSLRSDSGHGPQLTEDADENRNESAPTFVAKGATFVHAVDAQDSPSRDSGSPKSHTTDRSTQPVSCLEPQSDEDVDETWPKYALGEAADGTTFVDAGHAEDSPSRSCGSLASQFNTRSPQPHSGPGPQSTEDDEDWINSELGAVAYGTTFVDVGRAPDTSSRDSRSIDSHTTTKSHRSDSDLGSQLTEDDDGKWIKSGLEAVADRPSSMDRGHVEDWSSSATRSLDHHTIARSPPSDSVPGPQSSEDDENWIKFARGAVAEGATFMDVDNAQDTPSRAGRWPKSSTSAGSPRSDSGLELQSAEVFDENWIRSTLGAVARRAQFVGGGHAGDSPSRTCESLERHTLARSPQPHSGPRPQATEGDDEDWTNSALGAVAYGSKFVDDGHVQDKPSHACRKLESHTAARIQRSSSGLGPQLAEDFEENCIKSAFGTVAEGTASVGVDAQGSPSSTSRLFKSRTASSSPRSDSGHKPQSTKDADENWMKSVNVGNAQYSPPRDSGSPESHTTDRSTQPDTCLEPQSDKDDDDTRPKYALGEAADGTTFADAGHAKDPSSRSCRSLASQFNARSPQPHSGRGPQSTEDDEDWTNSALGAVAYGTTFVDVGRAQDTCSRDSRSLDSHTITRSPQSDSGLEQQFAEDVGETYIKPARGAVAGGTTFVDAGRD